MIVAVRHHILGVCFIYIDDIVSIMNERDPEVILMDICKPGQYHDDGIKWKHLPRDWPFVRGIHRWPVNSPYKGQSRGSLMFSLICAWINGWVNNRESSDLRHHRAHYDVIVMTKSQFQTTNDRLLCMIIELYFMSLNELIQNWLQAWLVVYMVHRHHLSQYWLS